MERPSRPAWFDERFAQWKGLKFEWVRWAKKDTAMPVLGLAFYRREDDDGEVFYRYMLPGKQEAIDWYRPGPECVTSHRYVVWDLVRGMYVKVLDCIDDEGRLVPPGQGILDALDRRFDAWEETVKAIDLEEEAWQTDDGRYLNQGQLAARKEAEEAAREPFMKLAEEAGGVVRVPLFDPPASQKRNRHRGEGFAVMDKRRFKDDFVKKEI